MVKSKDKGEEKKRPERLSPREVLARAREEAKAAQQAQRPSSHATHAKTAALLDGSSPAQTSRSISISSGGSQQPSSAASSATSISGSIQSNSGRPPRFYRAASEIVTSTRQPQPPNARPGSSQTQARSSESSAPNSPQPQSPQPAPLASSQLSNDEVAVIEDDGTGMTTDDWTSLLKNYRRRDF